MKISKKQSFSHFRIAVFTHDTFGLGHIRRCLHIMNALSERSPQSAMLLITGSPVVHTLSSLPPNADFVKIPTIVKTGASGSQPPHLPIALPEVQLLRERLIREAVSSFQPDIFLVDNFPLGAQRELLPILQELRRAGTRTILGLRDIVDAPSVVCTDWGRQGMYDILERYYDKILVYGIKEVLNVSEAYGLTPRIASKVDYCGYVTEQSQKRRPAGEIKKELGIKGKFIIVTGGGGGDAFPLLQNFLAATRYLPHISALVLTGPLMGSNDLNKLKAQVNGRAHIIMKEFVKDFSSYLAAADAVVSMCGYNMAAEILIHKKPAVVCPRTWRFGEHVKGNQAGLEWEQILRARSLAKAGLVELIEYEALKPRTLASRINRLLESPRRSKGSRVNVQGLHTAVQHILSLADQR
ncbi:MAG TPA: glycosyltransferase [bacterium]|nr:glycosyltransferase [bacterium]